MNHQRSIRLLLSLLIIFSALPAWAGGEPVALRILAQPSWGPGAVHFGIQTWLTDIDDWSWDFGDSSPPSDEPSPVHVYTAAGSYTVSLTVHAPSYGWYTVTAPHFVHINDPVLTDDFNDYAYSAALWEHFAPELLVGKIDDTAAEMAIVVAGPSVLPPGSQNGKIICLGADGPRLPGDPDPSVRDNGRFKVALELIDGGAPGSVSFTAFQLLRAAPALAVPLAWVEVRNLGTHFELRIAGPDDVTSPWLALAGDPASQRAVIELDWYLLPVALGGVLEMRIKDAVHPGGPILSQRLDTLTYSELGFDTIELGVIDVLGEEIGSEADKIRFDDFEFWSFAHHPE